METMVPKWDRDAQDGRPIDFTKDILHKSYLGYICPRVKGQ